MDWPLGLLQQSSHLKLGFCFMCCICVYLFNRIEPQRRGGYAENKREQVRLDFML